MKQKREVILTVFSILLLFFIVGFGCKGCTCGPSEPSPCTESAWECTAWSECIDGEQTRTCTLIDTECSDPDAVKPAETQACAPQPECTTDDDCEGDLVCVDGECVESVPE